MSPIAKKFLRVPLLPLILTPIIIGGIVVVAARSILDGVIDIYGVVRSTIDDVMTVE